MIHYQFNNRKVETQTKDYEIRGPVPGRGGLKRSLKEALKVAVRFLYTQGKAHQIRFWQSSVTQLHYKLLQDTNTNTSTDINTKGN